MPKVIVRFGRHVARHAVVGILFIGAAVAGTLSGVLFAYAGDIPEITALDDYAPNTITRVYARDGQVIGEYATERRSVVAYEGIALHLRNAILAVEDAQFNSHVGLSMSRIVIAAATDIMEGRAAQGASTLTQQLARNIAQLGLNPREKTVERKIKEALLALQIEKRYTKREIFTLYANQIYLGHGAHGVEAASRLYFGKHASEVTLAEGALIAAVIQAPSRLSPFVDINRAKGRRDYVLNRMAAEELITAADAAAARAEPITLREQASDTLSVAPHFVEEVRKYLEATYGATQLYESGLNVHTSLDPTLQAAANRAVDLGLRQLDKRRGFRKPSRNVIDDGQAVDEFQHERWARRLSIADIVPAVVTEVEQRRIAFRVGPYQGTLAPEDFQWTRRASATELVRPGDLIDIAVTDLDPDALSVAGLLEQTPLVEGALLAIDNRTGQVRAMVGGFSFDRSKFNRATQALRQLGSTFKPILYAAAIDGGYTPASILMDEPIAYSPGPDQPDYAPTNYDHTYEGPITLRHALEKSRNVPAVQMMYQLGPEHVANYARRLGFTSPLPAVLSLALGAGEATLLEVVSAYSVFPNRGVRMKPFWVLNVSDREGNVLEENRPEPIDAVRADTAFVMTYMLQGVIQRGTATRARSLDWPLGGKTGTVDDFTDASFIGFDPDITVGVWVGHDEKKPLGNGEEGARAALPIWIDFMRAYIETRDAPPEFTPPANVVFVSIDKDTGTVADGLTATPIREAFVAGTQPGVGFPR